MTLCALLSSMSNKCFPKDYKFLEHWPNINLPYYQIKELFNLSAFRPWLRDRFMAPDIAAAHRLLVDQRVSIGTSN